MVHSLLGAYDAQLRGQPELTGARAVVRVGPVYIATFAQGRGFISYRSLGAGGALAGAAGVRALVTAVVQHLEQDRELAEVEWKARTHDHAPGLHGALLDHGFVPQEPESIMIGEARLLAVDVPLPDGVTLRRITAEADVRAMAATSDEVFGDPPGDRHALDLLRSQAADPDLEMWVAEAGGVMVSTGRLEPVAGTQFAGLWGGATRPAWRGRGIYRALTAARARSALRLGKRWLTSDSTPYSRPVLERSGLQRVSQVMPYHWTR